MKSWIISSLLFCLTSLSFGQAFPEGMSFQAQVKGADGIALAEENIAVRFAIRENSIGGTIVWGEEHDTETGVYGNIELIVGEGISTGDGTLMSFSDIIWSSGIYFLEMLVDIENDGSFTSVSTQQLMSVPFAFHAETTSQEFELADLTDVNTTGLAEGDLLRWNGAEWVPGVFGVVDSAYFAFYADSTDYADTAGYALNLESLTFVDSSAIALYADSAGIAGNASHATYADSAVYGDTAGVALIALNNWGLSGNDNSDAEDFLGTIDSMDLKVRTNNEERMRILANGKIAFGTSTPESDFHIDNVDGFLVTGEIGTGTIPIEGAGTRMMFYPNKGAFRAGRVTGTNWNDGLIGDYSFASGFNTRASGDYSTSFGFSSSASGEGALAAGNASIASGDYSFAAGHSPQATGANSIALGRAARALADNSIAIGYHPTASAEFSISLGNFSSANQPNSIAIGYRSNAEHEGSFIFTDQSTDAFQETTAENQFMVVASGGTIFYTDPELTTGVELLPGAGAWSILSDRQKKENIEPVKGEEYLERLNDIEVHTWNYISQDSSIRHIGPMAQDFYATFEIGSDSTLINSGDFDGINLLLIKSLDEKISLIEEQSSRISEMNEQLEELKEQREKLYRLILELERKVENYITEDE